MTATSMIQVGDHAPEPVHASPYQAKTALAWVRDEILLGRGAMRPKYHRFEDAVAAVVDAFEDGRFAEIKEAAASLHDIAKDIAATAKQIEGLSSSLVKGCVDQLRRPRS